MKIIILSTDKSILKWKSLPTKIARLEKVLKVWDISVETIDSIPLIVNGRVAKYWLNYLVQNHFNLGYDIVALHMSDKQRKAWGVKPSLLGSNPNTKQEYGDFYFWSDENTKNKKHGGDEQFYQTFLHELAHEYFQQTGLKDVTHLYHDEFKDITGLIESFDWTIYQPKRMALKKQVPLLKRVVELLVKLKGMQTFKNPVPNFPISQKFGVRNAKFYPQTKHHLGTDWATPNKTPIPSPVDGEITDYGNDKTRGNWLEITSGGHYWYFFHLAIPAIKKIVKQGDIIGYTGNTGKSTGYHCHVELWKQRRDVSLLTEQNFKNYLIDIETLWNHN